MPLPSGFDRTATYLGASNRPSTWPLRIGQEAPASVTMPSGEVRGLVMVAYVEPSDIIPQDIVFIEQGDLTEFYADCDERIAAIAADRLRGAA